MVLDPDKLEQNDETSDQSIAPRIIDEVVLSPEEIQHQADELDRAKQSEKNTPDEIAELRQGLGIVEHSQETQAHDKDEHERAHEEQNKKEIEAIERRAEIVGGKVGERAKKILEGVEDTNFNLMLRAGDFAEIMKNPEERRKFYPGWSFDEIRQLQEVLLDKSDTGKSFNEAQKERAEADEIREKMRKDAEEWDTKKKAEREAEEARQAQEKKERDERRQKEAAEYEREQEAQKLEEQTKKGFFSRLFGRK